MDDATATFVALCDRVLEEARKLEALYEARGDFRAGIAQRVIDFVSGRRRAAIEGTLDRPSSGYGLGFSRFVGDVEWGPEGKQLHEAATDAELHWQERM